MSSLRQSIEHLIQIWCPFHLGLWNKNTAKIYVSLDTNNNNKKKKMMKDKNNIADQSVE